jgi:hypothetical protein
MSKLLQGVHMQEIHMLEVHIQEVEAEVLKAFQRPYLGMDLEEGWMRCSKWCLVTKLQFIRIKMLRLLWSWHFGRLLKAVANKCHSLHQSPVQLAMGEAFLLEPDLRHVVLVVEGVGWWCGKLFWSRSPHAHHVEGGARQPRYHGCHLLLNGFPNSAAKFLFSWN